MGRTVYKSKIDWWVWGVLAFTVFVFMAISITSSGWLLAIFVLVFAMMFGVLCVGFFGVRYVVEGDKLIVYMFCRPKTFPINKIRDVKPVWSILSAPACSTERLAIRFTDRSVLRSSMPLEISPLRKKEFIKHLVSINPDIIVNE